MKNEIMLDLETLGLSNDAAIVSIGAVAFTADGITSNFKRNLKLRDVMDAGGVVDSGAIEWWFQQPKEVVALWMDNAVQLVEGLSDFSRWYRENNGGFVWGNGATFDNVILRTAYKRAKLVPPWHFRDDACFRTMRNMFIPKDFKPKLPNNGHVHHDSLSDAIYQAETLIQSGVLKAATQFRDNMLKAMP